MSHPNAQHAAEQTANELYKSPEQTTMQRFFAESLLPVDILNNAEIAPLVATTLHLAATSLGTVESQFGSDALHPKIINGRVERGVLATYHNSTHTQSMMMKYSLAYANLCRIYDGPDSYSNEDLVLQVLAAAGHDIVQGDGRGEDERQSAELVVQLMEQSQFGYTQAQRDKVYHSIYATTFNPLTKQQSVEATRPFLPMQKATAIGDLLSLCRPHGPVYGIALSVETFMLQESNYGQILRHEAEKTGFPVSDSNLIDCLQFYDQHPLLREAYTTHLQGQSGFLRQHSYPDPRVDQWFPGREANAVFVDELAAWYTQGSITAPDTYRLALQRAQVLSAAT